MTLYQEILFLQGYFNGKWCVENVVPWYKPLIPAQQFSGHLFWVNFPMSSLEIGTRGMGNNENIKQRASDLGFDLTKYKRINKRLAIRDCTEPELGKHILEWAMKMDLTLFPNEKSTTLKKRSYPL